MISRRNIRVKVMQSLYTLEATFQSEESLSSLKTIQKGIKILHDKINDSAELFTLMLAYLSRIAQYAETDAHNRSAKYLPSEEDKKVNIKISGNTFLWDLLENNTFKEKIKQSKLDQYINPEWIRKLYRSLIQSTPYHDYISNDDRNPLEEKNIMKHIWFKEMLVNEDFIEYISDEWSSWEDDKEMLFMLFENFFKAPINLNFLKFISAEKKEYAVQLLETTLEKGEYVLSLIQPKFKNWDTERIALIDLTLLKMGVCELLYFPTIPTKVTINEYIEIAKHYSTEQSGQFVNGVLDNILKDLVKEGEISKVDRKK